MPGATATERRRSFSQCLARLLDRLQILLQGLKRLFLDRRELTTTLLESFQVVDLLLDAIGVPLRKLFIPSRLVLRLAWAEREPVSMLSSAQLERSASRWIGTFLDSFRLVRFALGLDGVEILLLCHRVRLLLQLGDGLKFD